ncbi:single-stranded DNA-binding protein [Terasakiella pusilla]|uniref:single-stranded DNA-binding protein n=1 Tax=Terasakiella pusilla TaxID=64973 RepID=UPI003AA8CA11
MDFPFLYVEVANAPIVKGRSGISKSNQPYTIPDKQTAALFFGGQFPHPVEIPVPEGKSPYQPGLYLLTGAKLVRPGANGPEINLRDAELVSFEVASEALSKAKPNLKAA